MSTDESEFAVFGNWVLYLKTDCGGLANSHSNTFVWKMNAVHTYFLIPPWLRGPRLIMLVLSMMNVVISVGVCVCAAIIVWALLCKYYFRGQTSPHYQRGHRPQPKDFFKQEEVTSGHLDCWEIFARFSPIKDKKAHIFVAFHHFTGGKYVFLFDQIHLAI